MSSTEVAVFGGGCFWCTEAVFSELKGVVSVTAGYAGGSVQNPTYEQVCSGTTGHVEVVRVEFDPKQVSYRDLLLVFFITHNPTTINQQGGDVGEQYRSVIFYTTPAQQKQVMEYIGGLTKDKVYSSSIVTKVEPLDVFYAAEDYHQKYYRDHKEASYCQAVIDPKLAKLRSRQAALLK